MKPHKHAELIKAWADGAEIQINWSGDWKDTNFPDWSEFMQYRIRPNKRKYRVAEMFNKEYQKPYVATANSEDVLSIFSSDPDFIRWLTDWIEYDATNTETK